MVMREIQVFSVVSGKYQCSYDLDEMSKALEDIEGNGYQVVNINFAPDGNLVLFVADLLSNINEDK